MGGATLWKCLWEYHKKIENNLNRYTRGEGQLLSRILEEIEVYGAIEDEVVFPLVEPYDANWVEMASAANDKLKDLSADIQNLEPGDPMETKLVKRLQKTWLLHCQREERQLFPLLKTRLYNESFDAARNAFTVRQELVAARGGVAPPGQYFIGLPGSGWTKQLVVGGGW